MRTGIYLRISDDRDGTSTATSRQLEDCRKLAEARGWAVADVFEDSDLSAFKRRVIRPDFERMLQAVKDRQIDVVLAWKLDRITRRIRDFARLDEECETAGARIVTVIDAIDTSTSAGRVIASIMTALARAESENISVRVLRKAREMALAGIPSTGGHRPFGYSPDRSTIVEPEAAVIRESAARVLAGASIRGICFDLEKRGVVSSSGKPWQAAPLRRMLTSALLSAQRDYGGVFTAGKWPAILTPNETQRLRAVLNDPRRRKSFSNARSYLLSGMLRCGVCGEPLIARPQIDGQRRYVCAKQPGRASCGKLARLAQPVEEFLFEATCVALDGVNLLGHSAEEQSGAESAATVEAIREDERSLIELAEDYANKLFTRGEFFAARDVIEARLSAHRNSLGTRTGQAMLADLSGSEALRKRWPTESLDWKRAVLAAIIDHVVIASAVKGKNKFDPTLVKIVWRY